MSASIELKAIELKVNGAEHSVRCPPATPLLLALRGDMDLRGTRHGCATGDCGACTVLVDGRPTASCTTPLEAVSGQSVETIEGLADDPVGAALFAAFMTHQAGQCGYCLAGILVEAKALLRRIGQPSRAEIAAALDGHLCRCGAHNRILDAIEDAARTVSRQPEAST